MSEQDKDTQGQAVNPNPETTEEKLAETTETVQPEVAPEVEPEKPIGDIIAPVQEEKPQKKDIGQRYIEEKKLRKEHAKKIKELEERIAQGESHADVSDDIEALAKEHNIDSSFLNKLVSSIEQKAEKSLEERIDAKLEPLTKKEREAKVSEVFTKAYAEVIERMPEFKDVANADVIKTLATNPANSKKTLSQILEETYGNAITGKRTIETTKPGGGKEPTEVDYDRAKSDSAYFKEIMANPNLKKKYNEQAMDELTRLL